MFIFIKTLSLLFSAQLKAIWSMPRFSEPSLPHIHTSMHGLEMPAPVHLARLFSLVRCWTARPLVVQSITLARKSSDIVARKVVNRLVLTSVQQLVAIVQLKAGEFCTERPKRNQLEGNEPARRYVSGESVLCTDCSGRCFRLIPLHIR